MLFVSLFKLLDKVLDFQYYRSPSSGSLLVIRALGPSYNVYFLDVKTGVFQKNGDFPNLKWPLGRMYIRDEILRCFQSTTETMTEISSSFPPR